MLQTLNPKDARVLVVEDSSVDQELAKRALKAFGVRHISLARTSEDALIELMKRSHDIALLHADLHGLDGVRFMENLRRVSPQTRVIVVTASRQQRLDPATRRLGAIDYISKDDYLTSRVTRALQAALTGRVAEFTLVEKDADLLQGRELDQTLEEAGWLLKAMEQRRIASAPDSILDLRRAKDWSLVLDTFVSYIQASSETFPQPAIAQLNDLVEAMVERSMGPREVFALYMQAVKSVMEDSHGRSAPARPSLFLVQAFACLVEELQDHIVSRELA